MHGGGGGEGFVVLFLFLFLYNTVTECIVYMFRAMNL